MSCTNKDNQVHFVRVKINMYILYEIKLICIPIDFTEQASEWENEHTPSELKLDISLETCQQISYFNIYYVNNNNFNWWKVLKHYLPQLS